MRYTIALAQCGFPADGDVLSQVGRLAAEAADNNADLLVYPEDLMSPRPLDPAGLREVAEPLDGLFAHEMAKIARHHGLWIAYTMYEARSEGRQPFNTAVLVDGSGTMRGSYRKCHLYDAHGVLESERTGTGEELFSPVAAPFATIGLGICYDLRFPELARAEAVAGCNVLLFPSAWHDGPEKVAHWETLLRARAIENEVFVAGVCKAGERYVGESLVADPLGRVIARLDGKGEGLLVCEIDTDEVACARDAMPLLEHRRPELY